MRATALAASCAIAVSACMSGAPPNEAEFSANFDQSAVAPTLLRVSQLVESGFDSVEAAALTKRIAELPVDAQGVYRYKVRFADVRRPLRIEAFKDDIDAPDLHFYGDSALVDGIMRSFVDETAHARVVFLGVYTFGAEVETFRPCGDSLTYWVTTSPPMWDHLRDLHQSLTTKPYQGIYVAVQGMPTDGERDGFAADYDGLFRIDTVYRSSATIPASCTGR